ncbi:MAG: alpha-N-arabinofuranosidase [Thalassobius sp.]|nr:alpha-N-arabinofuranosidase [Thalassovita sp.]
MRANSFSTKGKSFYYFLLVVFFLPCFACFSQSESVSTFTNPILLDGADPYAYYHTDNYYYYMATRGNRIDLWKTKSLTTLAEASPITVWKAPANGKNSCCIWAPEIHFIDGKWYIYYTASDKDNEGDHSRFVFVLENSSPDPTQGEWTDKGKINTKYSGIDGSVFSYKGKRYFLYSPYIGSHSDISIAEMKNPWTLKGEETILASPEFDWEKTDDRSILEGPMFLEGPKDKVFIVYSGGACWDDNYSLGMLVASKKGNFLKASTWKKAPEPVLSMSEENQVYGPGHHGFAKSPDGTETWVIYHAKDKPGLGCAQRSSRMQVINWDKKGMPVFGKPVNINDPIKKPSGE